MNTLDTEPVSTLIAALYADAEITQARFMTELNELSPVDRTALLSNDADYRTLYARARNVHLAVSPATGTLLYLLARSSQARSVVEFGTSFGISTLHLAAALRDNGGGRLLTAEFETTKAHAARRNMQRAGLDDLVEVREGDALDTLARDLPAEVDLLLLDGAKGLYPAILALVAPRLRPGALVIADNADRSPAYLDHVRSPVNGYVSIPFASDVELSMKAA